MFTAEAGLTGSATKSRSSSGPLTLEVRCTALAAAAAAASALMRSGLELERIGLAISKETKEVNTVRVSVVNLYLSFYVATTHTTPLYNTA